MPFLTQTEPLGPATPHDIVTFHSFLEPESCPTWLYLAPENSLLCRLLVAFRNWCRISPVFTALRGQNEIHSVLGRFSTVAYSRIISIVTFEKLAEMKSNPEEFE